MTAEQVGSDTGLFIPFIEANHWQRLWSRQFDIIFFGYLIALAIGAIFPNFIDSLPLGISGDIQWHIITLPLIALFCSLCIATFGNSPGKALCGIRVVRKSRQRLDLSISLQRELYVYVRGLALGFPFLSLIAGVLTFSNIKHGLTTPWDARVSTSVENVGGNFFRTTFVAIFVIIELFTTVIVLNLQGKAYRQADVVEEKQGAVDGSSRLARKADFFITDDIMLSKRSLESLNVTGEDTCGNVPFIIANSSNKIVSLQSKDLDQNTEVPLAIIRPGETFELISSQFGRYVLSDANTGSFLWRYNVSDCDKLYMGNTVPMRSAPVRPSIAPSSTATIADVPDTSDPASNTMSGSLPLDSREQGITDQNPPKPPPTLEVQPPSRGSVEELVKTVRRLEEEEKIKKPWRIPQMP